METGWCCSSSSACPLHQWVCFTKHFTDAWQICFTCASFAHICFLLLLNLEKGLWVARGRGCRVGSELLPAAAVLLWANLEPCVLRSEGSRWGALGEPGSVWSAVWSAREGCCGSAEQCYGFPSLLNACIGQGKLRRGLQQNDQNSLHL